VIAPNEVAARRGFGQGVPHGGAPVGRPRRPFRYRWYAGVTLA